MDQNNPKNRRSLHSTTPSYPHPAWIEVDLAQFQKNIHAVRKQIGKSLYCLPVKANAYGHGLCEIGKTAEASGIDYLAVAHLKEGIELRQSGIEIPILVLGAIHEDQITDLADFNLEFTISSQFKADIAEKKLNGRKVRVHLEVDTGMHRTGVRPETAKKLFHYLQSLPSIEVVGIYSHLATADKPGDRFALEQIQRFKSLLEDPIFSERQLIRHLANSGATAYYPEAHLDMVRPSLLTLGYGPGVSPCFSVKAKVSYFKVVEKGQGISYGHFYQTAKKTRIVTIPVGYGDGFLRMLSNKGHVLIRGKKYPIVGSICMDQFMVDVGEDEIHVGDEAVLIGKQGNQEIRLTEIADLCQTIPYEILTLFNNRIPRIYETKNLSE